MYPCNVGDLFEDLVAEVAVVPLEKLLHLRVRVVLHRLQPVTSPLSREHAQPFVHLLFELNLCACSTN
jgi:hypothetical protein